MPAFRNVKYLPVLLASCLAVFFLLRSTSRADGVNGPTFELAIVRDSDQGTKGTEVLYRRRTHPGETFRVAYTHSSDKCPIYEVFRVEENASVTLLEEAYGWFGAGLEFNPKTGFTKTGDDMVHILNIEKNLKEIPIRVGWICDFRLEFKDGIVPLTSLAPSGDLVWIKIIRAP
ncbi:MAG: DUF1850 domain-containing protein [Candidatus Latescibacterota bacterium]